MCTQCAVHCEALLIGDAKHDMMSALATVRTETALLAQGRHFVGLCHHHYCAE